MSSNEITLEDLSIVVSMIDACAVRGAFKGEELSAVAKIREKFNSIVKEATAKEEEKAEGK